MGRRASGRASGAKLLAPYHHVIATTRASRDVTRLNEGDGRGTSWGGGRGGTTALTIHTKLFPSRSPRRSLLPSLGTLRTLARDRHPSSRGDVHRSRLFPRTPDCQLTRSRRALDRFATKREVEITVSRQRAWPDGGTERKRRPTRDGSTWRTDGSAVIFPTSAPSIVALSAPTRCAVTSLPAALNCPHHRSEF